MRHADDGIRLIELDKTANESLGVTLEDSFDCVCVASVSPASLAFGLLNKGDEILSINHVNADSANEASQLIRASAAPLRLNVRDRTLAGHREPSLTRGWLVLIVLGLTGFNGWMAFTTWSAMRAQQDAQREAHKWQFVASSSKHQMETERAAQRALVKQSDDLRKRIRELKHANASASLTVLSALHGLREQRLNVSEQRKSLRQVAQRAQQQASRAREERSGLVAELIDERRRTSEALEMLRRERSQPCQRAGGDAGGVGQVASASMGSLAGAGTAPPPTVPPPGNGTDALLSMQVVSPKETLVLMLERINLM